MGLFYKPVDVAVGGYKERCDELVRIGHLTVLDDPDDRETIEPYYSAAWLRYLSSTFSLLGSPAGPTGQEDEALFVRHAGRRNGGFDMTGNSYPCSRSLDNR